MAAAALASKRGSQALLRAAPASPAPSLLLRGCCTKMRVIGSSGGILNKMRRQDQKLNQILEILKERSKTDEKELRSLRNKVVKLSAYVYYGGILFGGLTAVALTFPIQAYQIQGDVAQVKADQETDRTMLHSMADRVKALEGAIMARETQGSEPDEEANQVGEVAKPSWLISALTFMRVM